MPKAGSTALQASLADARDRLARIGVLYPRGPFIPRTHNFLIAGIEERKRELPRLLTAYRDRWTRSSRLSQWMATSRRPCRAVGTLILSSEWLFRLRADSRSTVSPDPPRPRRQHRGRRQSAGLRPVSLLRQQILKGSHVIKPVAPIRYRRRSSFARIADRIRRQV
jgi:hypothetical protein